MPITSGMIFSLPHPRQPGHRIMPVFLPFAGCRTRCLYCASSAQTGLPDAASGERGLAAALASLEKALQERKARMAPPVELGFYGGTFTALPDMWTERFLALAAAFRACGTVSAVRCSTRPDAVSLPQLARLKALGLGAVELGVQSFDDEVLARSLRGYAGAVASEACRLVRAAGLELGIQLLPGLPGHSPAMFMDDVRTACSLGPSTMRLYPCVVFRGTGLERLHARGEYVPWSLDTAADACAEALGVTWEHGVRVIRMGIAQEPGLEHQIVAGPYHPAFGSMVRGRALAPLLLRRIAALGCPPRRLMAPQHVRGEFWGYRGECKARYAEAGLTPDAVFWWQAPLFFLQ